jgi:hypothetical protein
MNGGGAMTRYEYWLAWTAAVGTAAGLVAAALIWLVLTRPVALAQVLAGGS